MARDNVVDVDRIEKHLVKRINDLGRDIAKVREMGRLLHSLQQRATKAQEDPNGAQEYERIREQYAMAIRVLNAIDGVPHISCDFPEHCRVKMKGVK